MVLAGAVKANIGYTTVPSRTERITGHRLYSRVFAGILLRIVSRCVVKIGCTVKVILQRTITCVVNLILICEPALISNISYRLVSSFVVVKNNCCILIAVMQQILIKQKLTLNHRDGFLSFF